MEKESENEGFEKLMEKYNFDSPIEVSLVIEEDDPPEPVLLKELLLSNNANVPNTNVFKNSSEVYKRKDSNIDKDKIKMLNAKKNCNSKSVVEESNHSNSVFKTVLSEGHQKETQDIEWQLLDAVADNLIHITKCYYHNFINNTKQIEHFERLTLEYLTFKHYVFNLSYSTTITILLPRENDIYFLKTFIHRIIEIAKRSSWFKITFQILEKLIREMFMWTKQKKTNLDIKFGSHIHKKGGLNSFSCALTNSNNPNLNRSSDNGPIKKHASKESNSQPDTVPKTHLPVQITKISPNIRHISNYTTQEPTSPLIISSRTNYPKQDANNPTNSKRIKNNAKPKRTKKKRNNRSELLHSQPEIIVSPYFIPKTNHSNQGTSTPWNIYRRNKNSMEGINHFPDNGSNVNHSTETITSIYSNETKINNFNKGQAINTDRSKIIFSAGLGNQDITISVDLKTLNNVHQQYTNQLNNSSIESHVKEAHGTKSIKGQKNIASSYFPYSNSNSIPCNVQNIFHHNIKNCSATTSELPVDDPCRDDSEKDSEYELYNTDKLRSSVSRDSGCGSPIYGSFCNEQTIETPNNGEQVFPIISHVTSMNPNAVRLNVGFCKVCGASTSNMCIGCYKEYYCSFLCQTKGWENHKHLCSALALQR